MEPWVRTCRRERALCSGPDASDTRLTPYHESGTRTVRRPSIAPHREVDDRSTGRSSGGSGALRSAREPPRTRRRARGEDGSFVWIGVQVGPRPDDEVLVRLLVTGVYVTDAPMRRGLMSVPLRVVVGARAAAQRWRTRGRSSR
nr:hypothetical protein GCM10010200_035110 [Actinomadura rugatobispora]